MKQLLSATLATTLLIGTPALAQDQASTLDPANHAGSYLCITDASGGVYFNERSKKWEGTPFRAGQRYIVNIKPHSVVEEEDTGTTLTAYSISLKKHGSDDGPPNIGCFNKGDQLWDVDPLLHWVRNGRFYCQTYGGYWDMDLYTNRFSRVNTFGFVDGNDKDPSTPNIEVGYCSQID